MGTPATLASLASRCDREAICKVASSRSTFSFPLVSAREARWQVYGIKESELKVAASESRAGDALLDAVITRVGSRNAL